MLILLKLSFISFLCVMALKIAMSDKMLLSNLGEYFEKKVDEGNKVFDLFICPWCMGTLQSITAHLFAFGLGILPLSFNFKLLIRLPLIIFLTSISAGLVWTIYLTINSIKENYDLHNNFLKEGEEDGKST